MSGVNEWIVREFFESHGFFVRAQRKYLGRGDEEIDLLMVNPQPVPPNGSRAFVLGPEDLKFIPRALVAIKGWHTEVFSAARLISTPDILRFTQPAALRKTLTAFGTSEPVVKILVLPNLPSTKTAHDETIEILKTKGLDAVLLFQTVLAHLVESVEINRNYQKSDLLQLIRILKNYDFLKDRQLELFKSRRNRRKAST